MNKIAIHTHVIFRSRNAIIFFIENVRLSRLSTMTSLLSFMVNSALVNRAGFRQLSFVLVLSYTISKFQHCLQYDVIVAYQVFDKENMALRDLKITWVCIAVLFISCSIIV